MPLSMVALLMSVLAAPARAQQEGAPDSAAADTVAAPDATADSVAADTAASTAAVPHVVPSLEGFRKVAILSRDMLPGTPGYETAVEIYRGPDRAQVLRFVTGGVAWAFVVGPPGTTDAYTLRDFDCSGGFTEDLEAGTPLAVPDCAVPARPAAAPTDD
jgi:hypothetical protein